MCALLTAQELEAGSVKVKDLDAATQDDVPLSQLAGDLKRRIVARGGPALTAPRAQPGGGGGISGGGANK